MSEEVVEGRGSSKREGGRERKRESRAHTRSVCVRGRERVSERVGRGEGRRFKSNCY